MRNLIQLNNFFKMRNYIKSYNFNRRLYKKYISELFYQIKTVITLNINKNNYNKYWNNANK